MLGEQMGTTDIHDFFRCFYVVKPHGLHKKYPEISRNMMPASGLDGQTMESMDHYVKTVVRCWASVRDSGLGADSLGVVQGL